MAAAGGEPLHAGGEPQHEPHAEEDDDAMTHRDEENLERYRQSMGTRSEQERRFGHTGEMTKLGRLRKSWRRRAFAVDVHSRCLLYFRNEEHLLRFSHEPACNTGVLGCVLLEKAQLYLPDFLDEAGEGRCVEITTAPPAMRHYFAYADTVDEMREWVAALSLCGVTVAAPRPTVPLLRHVHTEPYTGTVLTFGKQGFLEKRGYYNKAFKRRFFRVGTDAQTRGHCLAYFARYDNLQPRGVVQLLEAHVVDADSRNPGGVEFLVKARDRTYVLRAGSPDEKNEWIRTLQVMAALQEGEPTPTLRVQSVYEERAAREEAARREAAARARREADEERRAQSGGGLDAAAGAAAGRSELPPDKKPFRGSTRKLREQQRDEDKARREEQRQRRRGRLRAVTSAEENLRQVLLDGTVMTKFGRKGAPHARAVFGVTRGASLREKAEEAAALKRAKRELKERKKRDKAQAKKKAAPGGADKEAAGEKEEVEVEKEEEEKKKARRAHPPGGDEAPEDAAAAAAPGMVTLRPDGEVVDLCWADAGSDGRGRKQNPKRCVRIRPGTVVRRGKTTDVFARPVAESADQRRCLSIDDGERTLDLLAVSELERDAWADALEWAVRVQTLDDDGYE